MTNQNSEQELTSNVPYREAFQRGAASRDREIDELRAQLEENHARAEEIIKSRDNTIARFHAGIAELLDSMRPAEKPVDAEAWQWVIDRLIDLPAASLSAYHDSIVEKCAAACREELLTCDTGHAEDDAYNYAIDDATSAIERLKEQK
jgi:hypothetical protein